MANDVIDVGVAVPECRKESRHSMLMGVKSLYNAWESVGLPLSIDSLVSADGIGIDYAFRHVPKDKADDLVTAVNKNTGYAAKILS